MARLLVVDDEPDLRELLRVSLSMSGHQVEVAADGQRALDMALALRPDVMVLDVMMPRLDGWTVLSALKSSSDPAIAGIPVIMLTARTDDLDALKGGIEGAIRYLVKPFSLLELGQAVAEALSGAPEAEQRQAAQRAALAQLARLERGAGVLDSSVARPRMSRLEPVSGGQVAVAAASHEIPAWLASDLLTGRDREMLGAVGSTATISEARQRLQVSRSYLYARLHQLAVKLGFQSGPALVQALRAAHARKAVAPREQGP